MSRRARKLRRIMAELRIAFFEADQVTKDTLRPPRARELGPAYHRKAYAEARSEIRRLMDLAVTLIEAPEEPTRAPAKSRSRA